MYGLEVRHKFDAMHQLPDSEYLVTKACARKHGHTYGVRVMIEMIDDDLVKEGGGMVIDFKAIKDIIDVFDHQNVNEILAENGYFCEATAENIAKFLYEKIREKTGLISEVWVAEGYKGDEWSSWAKYSR